MKDIIYKRIFTINKIIKASERAREGNYSQYLRHLQKNHDELVSEVTILIKLLEEE